MKKVICVALLICIFSALFLPGVAANDLKLTDVMEAKTYSNSDISKKMELPYRIYVPNSYSESEKYSLLIHIHGAGERGSDNTAQIAQNDQTALIRRVISDKKFGEQFIIIAPQCPVNNIWVTMNWSSGTYSIEETPQTIPMKLLVSLLNDEILKNYSVDTRRIYVTGLSAGGYATWDLICRYPDMFAAAIPVCGGCDVSYAEAIKDIPIRIYHSSDDTIVSDTGSRGMFNELRKLGADVDFFDTKPWGHGAWGEAYADSDIINWMVSKVRTEHQVNSESAISVPLFETAVKSTSAIIESEDSTTAQNKNGWIVFWIAGFLCITAAFAVAVILKKKRG